MAILITFYICNW